MRTRDRSLRVRPLEIPLGVALLALGATSCTSSTAPTDKLGAGSATLETDIPFLSPSNKASAAASIDPQRPNEAQIVVTNLVGDLGVCDPVEMVAESNVKRANVVQLIIDLGADSSATLGPGRYTVGPALGITYRFDNLGCSTTDSGSATGGMVEIDSIDSAIHGSMDVRFPAGRVITSFDAPLCARTAPTGGGDGGSTCAAYPFCPADGGSSDGACVSF